MNRMDAELPTACIFLGWQLRRRSKAGDVEHLCERLEQRWLSS
jgi:hypothetical protein